MAITIAKKALTNFEDKLRNKGITLEATEDCYKWIAEKGLNSNYGAREINRTVEQNIKPYFVDQVLFGELSKGGTAHIDIKEGKIIIKKL
jgi:ATP-dependent Clp protease ATP-binding subunit ClpA